jgi:TatD DNase family protein
VIDFHCHLDLYPDPQAVRDECARRGIYVLSVTTTPSAWTGTSALGGNSPRIRTALGLHPQLAHERRSELTLFDTLIRETRYVGEIGLDGAPEFRKHWRAQVAVFEHILAKSRDAGGKIMSIHSRRASAEVLDQLERNGVAESAVLHWFSGSHRDLQRAIELGCWFSIGPAMLASEKGRSLTARIPKERLLTETDGPFAQSDGAPLKPWDVEKAIQSIADLWSMTQEEAERTIDANLRRLLTTHKVAITDAPG